MDPEVVRAWLRILRDIGMVGVAVFIFVHETLGSGDPSPELLAAALVLLGLPPILHVDRKANGS